MIDPQLLITDGMIPGKRTALSVLYLGLGFGEIKKFYVKLKSILYNRITTDSLVSNNINLESKI